jgi:hypothetical protein
MMKESGGAPHLVTRTFSGRPVLVVVPGMPLERPRGVLRAPNPPSRYPGNPRVSQALRGRRRAAQGAVGVKHPKGHRWEIFKQLIFRTYGNNCHICGCGGARHVDHLEPVTEDPALAWRLENCRPAHGAPGNPCPVCSGQAGQRIFCNQIRSMGSVDRARRIIAEKIEARQGRKTKKPGSPQRVRKDPGRVW